MQNQVPILICGTWIDRADPAEQMQSPWHHLLKPKEWAQQNRVQTSHDHFCMPLPVELWQIGLHHRTFSRLYWWCQTIMSTPKPLWKGALDVFAGSPAITKMKRSQYDVWRHMNTITWVGVIWVLAQIISSTSGGMSMGKYGTWSLWWPIFMNARSGSSLMATCNQPAHLKVTIASLSHCFLWS